MIKPFVLLICTAVTVSVIVGVSAAYASAPRLQRVSLLSEVSEPRIEFVPGEESDIYDEVPFEELFVPEVPLNKPAVILHTPPLDYLRRVVGDPKVLSNDVTVRVPVLMYHHVRPMRAAYNAKERNYMVTPDVFTAQMIELVEAGYTTITPDDLLLALKEGQSVLPEKSVLLTFDDGYSEHYKYVYPVLKKLKLKATFFIVTDDRPSRGSVTDAMLKEMDQSGLVTIAAHTKNHPFLTKLSKTKRDDEIQGSKKDLEALLGHSVDYFAYPFGAVSPQVIKEVEAAGYKLGFWVRFGSLHVSSGPFMLRRMRVQNGESIVDLLDAFSGPSLASSTKNK